METSTVLSLLLIFLKPASKLFIYFYSAWKFNRWLSNWFVAYYVSSWWSRIK